MAQLVDKVLFGQPASKQVKIDPTGLTLPTMTEGKVYAIDSSKEIVLSSAGSVLLLGVYIGTNSEGFLLFEQKLYTSTGAFTSAGTVWYLDSMGDLTSTPGTIVFGVAVDADNLLITPVGDGVVGGGEANTSSNQGGGAALALAKAGVDLPFRTMTSPGGTINFTENGNELEIEVANPGILGVDAQENGVSVLDPVDEMNFVSDNPDGKPFADVINQGGTTVDVEVDKQVDIDLTGSQTDQPTGFEFDINTYQCCEIFYLVSNANGEYETGSIYILHDETNAEVRVDPHDLSGAGGSAPNVTFGADVSGSDCRLLYTEGNGDDFTLSLKPRAMVQTEAAPPPQTVDVEFVSSSSNFPSDLVSTENIGVRIVTSDGNPLAAPVSVDVRDVGTGSGTPGVDYNFTTPQTLNWSIGEADGTVKNATIDILGNGEPDTVDLDLDNASGATEDTPNTHTVSLDPPIGS